MQHENASTAEIKRLKIRTGASVAKSSGFAENMLWRRGGDATGRVNRKEGSIKRDIQTG